MFYRNCIKSILHPGKYFCSTASSSTSEIVLSGIQPTGVLHIGNYFGAVKKWVELQNKNEDLLCSIVDLHAFTVSHDFQKLPENILLMAATLIACGINPQKSTLFLQSKVPYHTQLCWILGCITSTGRLGQLPQYKEKSASMKTVPIGLFLYPVLQAADILLYRATKVPVGEDQLPHLMFTSYLAQKFNSTYGNTFVIPRPLYGDLGCRIKSLHDPSKKMSKSDDSSRSRIEIMDSPDQIKFKFRKACTDTNSYISYEPETRPGVSNLVAIHSLLTDRHVTDICKESENVQTGQYKMIVADALIETLKPIQTEINHLLSNKPYLISVLEDGSNKAAERASDTWKLVESKVGINISKFLET